MENMTQRHQAKSNSHKNSNTYHDRPLHSTTTITPSTPVHQLITLPTICVAPERICYWPRLKQARWYQRPQNIEFINWSFIICSLLSLDRSIAGSEFYSMSTCNACRTSDHIVYWNLALHMERTPFMVCCSMELKDGTQWTIFYLFQHMHHHFLILSF